MDETRNEDVDEVALEPAPLNTELTVHPDEPIAVSGEVECDSVTNDPRLEKAFELIREAFADQRKQILDDILAAAGRPVAVQYGVPDRPKAQRAPAGSGRLLCERSLGQAAERGLTANRIHEMASTEYEKMLTVSAIRNELTTGEKSRPPRYKHVGGVWYLASFAPAAMRIVGGNE